MQILETIDKMVVSIFLTAEKKCVHTCTNTFSEEIFQQKQLIKYWKKVKAFHRGTTSIKYIKYLNKNHTENNFNKSTEDI